MRKTKIVCTLGPASREETVIEKMLLAGMNVARLNFSHGDHKSQGENIDRFRKVRDKLGLPAAVLLDTKGPEIRTGKFRDGRAYLEKGAAFTLTTKKILGDEKKGEITYKKLPKEVSIGDFILVDDGKIRLKVISTDEENILCQVITGGEISNHKGINVPKISLEMAYLNESDKKDILFGIEKDVDYIAASFVRRKEDVKLLREFLQTHGGENIKIIAKIENEEGIENFEDILEAADGIMVARGDMGVEVEFQRLPGIQKRVIKRCQQRGKIVITATQMLESMINNPLPTRAEITDVANAVFDGTSAVMLSGESAVGKYPVQAIASMAKIVEQAEADNPDLVPKDSSWHEMDASDTTNAVGHAACTMARDIKAKAIIAITNSGSTAQKMSKFRPITPIIGATAHLKTLHQLTLHWGVNPIFVENIKELELLIRRCLENSVVKGYVKEGDQVVISAGVPLDVQGNTNMIRVETVPTLEDWKLTSIGKYL